MSIRDDYDDWLAFMAWPDEEDDTRCDEQLQREAEEHFYREGNEQ